MTPFDHPEFDQHEQVLFCHDPETGLKAIIALHSTVLGPAAGGCRMHAYASDEEALRDVLRLSKGMTYKNAVAGLPLGGGKCVIIADPFSPQKPALLRAFSRHVQALGGRYWTAIDIGVGPEDADIMAENCHYIFCRASHFEPGFNPSSFTALGGFVGIRAVAQHLWGSDDLTGRTVAVQGLGATGYDLARRLHGAGARLIVADVRGDVVRDAVAEFGAEAVRPEAIHAVEADIFAPCAMGAVINDETLPELRVRAVCGLANNQLAEARHGADLKARGIAYVPDYVVNAGGVMGASPVIFTTPSKERSIREIEGLREIILQILNRSDSENRPSSEIADEMARARIAGRRKAAA